MFRDLNLPGRFETWHVKDMHTVNWHYAELGSDSMDHTRSWPDAAMSGMRHFFVEPGGNLAVGPMQGAADGIAYLKTSLQP